MSKKINFKDTKKKYDKTYFERRDLLIVHMAEVIRDLMNKNKLRKVLDVGCGTGLLVKYLKDSGFNAHGCDNSPEALKKARKINLKKIISYASATKLPYPNGFFDLVTAISLIEHLRKTEVEKFIKETRRILSPSGFIFIVTPNYSTPIRFIQGKMWFGYNDPTHINFFSLNDLSKLLKKHGFKNLQTKFRIRFRKSVNWEFPYPFSMLPTTFKKTAISLLFNSPLSIIRNSIWVVAQK